ncbi:adhesion G-protein coupled receptor G6-like isoform X2 [Gigantopelta aegis]|uniref:adhesion G-protein coupled receptor G6-like isoform X2 n=1 Tax=Gigantopelta aegis TaxID=1735272 RepID=UPI001B88D303|nr:adhesion G-protein coupled receptor G6-like isoform X2 [Gigantopelta aegis]
MWTIQWIVFVLFLKILQDVSGEKVEACRSTLCRCHKQNDRTTVSCRNQNGITEIPKNIPPATKVLDLSANSISSIMEDDLQNLEQLETLFLLQNSITEIHPKAFRNLYSLKTLVLSDNKLTEIMADHFQHLSSIQRIDLQKNNITYISKFAFITLPLNKKVTVMFGGNKHLYCGCALKAIRKSLSTNSKLYLDNLHCSNVKNKLPLNDMRDQDFPSCTEEEENIFPSRQYCRYCSSSRTNGKCLDADQNRVCHGQKMACINRVEYNRGRLNVSRGCMELQDCMALEAANKDTCAIQHRPTLHCNYCCVGNNCNAKQMGGRTSDFTFYVSFSLGNQEYKPELADQQSSEYIKLSNGLKAAMSSDMQDTEGGYSVIILGFTPPDLVVYLKIHSTNLNTHTEVQVKILIREIIQNGASKGALRQFKVNTQRLVITTREFKFCQSMSDNNDKGNFTWPLMSTGTVSEIQCPFKPAEGEDSVRIATRKCSLSRNGDPVWEDANYSSCEYTSGTTRDLQDLNQQFVTSDNVFNISKKLKTFAKDFQNFRKVDVGFAVNIVERILNVPVTMTSRPTILNTLSAVSSVMGVRKSTLLEAEQVTQASTRLLNSVDKIVNNVSLTDGNLSVVEPNLAVVAVKVDPDNFPGLVFSTTADNDQDSSLSNDTMRLLNTTNISDFNQSTSTAIALPNSMFTSLGAASKGIDRITFSLYQSDKLFSVYKDARSGPTINPTGGFVNNPAKDAVGDKDGDEATDPTPTTTTAATASPTAKFTTKVNSRVISASIPNIVIKDLREPVLISFFHVLENGTKPQCVFWDENTATAGQAGWSSRGCFVTESVADSFTTCACDHLTNFALMMDIYPDGISLSEDDKVALSIISYIGCGVSLLALIVTVATYLMFRKLRRDNPSKILVNLCITLAAANLIFLFGMQDYAFADPIACKVVAALMHFALLSALTWMAVEAFYMYLALVLVFKTYFEHFMLKCSLIGWGLPLVIVAITLGVGSTENYGLLGSGICWLKNPAFYIAFLAPVSLILLMNLLAFGLVLRQILGVSAKNLNKSDKASTVTQLRGAVGVIILLGLTYIFAIFAIGQASIVFYYLFAIFNSLQGLFIFIFYCVFKKDALNTWRRWLPCCVMVDEKSAATTSRATRCNIPQNYHYREQLSLLPVSSEGYTPNSHNTGKNSLTDSASGHPVTKRGVRAGDYSVDSGIGGSSGCWDSRDSTTI